MDRSYSPAPLYSALLQHLCGTDFSQLCKRGMETLILVPSSINDFYFSQTYYGSQFTKHSYLLSKLLISNDSSVSLPSLSVHLLLMLHAVVDT